MKLSRAIVSIVLALLLGHMAGQFQQTCPQPSEPLMSWIQFEHIQLDCSRSAQCTVDGIRKYFGLTGDTK